MAHSCGLKGRAVAEGARPFRPQFVCEGQVPRPLAWAEEARPVGAKNIGLVRASGNINNLHVELIKSS
jgi:hypothetical protein